MQSEKKEQTGPEKVSLELVGKPIQPLTPKSEDSRVYRSEAGETLLSRALDIISNQLSDLRELNDAARHLSEESAKKRRDLFMRREEVEYRLRYLSDKANHKKNNKLPTSPQELEKHRLSLYAKQAEIDIHEQEMADVQNDTDDAAKRLGLLVRQLEIAGSQLTRPGQTSNVNLDDMNVNPWEIVLRAQLVEGQEEERVRLAREIHDGPAQVLANAVMRLEHSADRLRQNRAEVDKELRELVGVMRESLFEIRRFMFNLQPRTLSQQGLTRTLQEYCADFGNQFALEIEIDFPDLTGYLNPDQEMAIFRIVQESLQNIRKHAEARRVRIVGGRDVEGRISILIQDDGKGFVIKTAELGISRGAGIPGMRERAELVGGKLTLNSVLGRGTEITIRLRPAGPKAPKSNSR